MSTLATANLGQSDDDEDDVDYVPTASKLNKARKRTAGKKRKHAGDGASGDSSDSGSGSDDSSDEASGDEDDDVAKLREERQAAEAADRKRRAAEMFKLMQEEAKGSSNSTTAAPKASEGEDEWVEVKLPRRFAGETIYETVKLRKTDPEAIKYLASQEQSAKLNGAEGPESSNGTASPASTTEQNGSKSESNAATPTPGAARPPGLRKGPIRKRPRQSLEAMAAAIDQGKKITTLEKSQMDWNKLKTTSKGMEDELAAHRKSGGYLEKQAFLDRVGERRAGAGAASSNGRRR